MAFVSSSMRSSSTASDVHSVRAPDHRLRPLAQAEAIRVISFRHEQNAGYAASIAGFLTRNPGSASRFPRLASSMA
jgi:hypothetical protein